MSRATLLGAALAAVAAIAAVFVALQLQQHALRSERQRNARAACVDQNRRHDQTILTLDRLLAQAEADATPTQLGQLRQSRLFTVLLVNALAPHQNCDAQVRLLVH